MSEDKFILSSGQAHEVELAMNRPENGTWTPELVHALTKGDTLGKFRDVLLGHAEVTVVDFFRETGELTGTNTIVIPALPRPTSAELHAKYAWIRKEDGIKLDISPTEVVTLRLGTLLRLDEERIDTAEYERRRASLTGQFGYQQLEWLVKHQDEHSAFKALLGKIYIDGTGLIVVDADGGRDFPYLYGNGRRWYLNWNWNDNDLNRNGRLAVSSNWQQRIDRRCPAG
jgi:hypothetical protein